MSVGTIEPRIVVTSWSAAARNSPSVFGSSVDHLQAAAAHHLDRLGVLRRRFGADARFERLRRGRHLGAILGADAVPRRVAT